MDFLLTTQTLGTLRDEQRAKGAEENVPSPSLNGAVTVRGEQPCRHRDDPEVQRDAFRGKGHETSDLALDNWLRLLRETEIKIMELLNIEATGRQ